MRPFSYRQAVSPEEASRLADNDLAAPANRAATQFIAGGTNMTDYMKLGVVELQEMVDLNAMSRDGLRVIDAGESFLRMGALVRMAEAEDDLTIRRDFPVVADSLKLAASRQIRNMASLGGNLLQRTRCEYFRHTVWPCNKREPGSGCSALNGVNRKHAVLGTSECCVATYAGDFAQALVALDATLTLFRQGATRDIAARELHRLPGDTPHVETVLAPGELILSISIPRVPWFRRSRYVKVRDRESYDFALASSAVALDLDGEIVREARIALGGLATVPWRSAAAERLLRGRRLTEDAARAAAAAAFADATPHGQSNFKIHLGQETLVRALLEARDMEIHSDG